MVTMPQTLDLILDHFPGHRQRILALSLSDRRFRSLLDDLRLAQDSLERFEALPDADQRPEVPEYRTIIQELEADVRTYLATHDTPSG
jgi:hypothetical protein